MSDLPVMDNARDRPDSPDPRDFAFALLHERATTVTESLGPVAIVTTPMALVEVLNHLAGRGERYRSIATQVVQELEARPDVELVSRTDAQFRATVKRYATRPDQTWSLTDRASFLVMAERNITEALAYDRDFEQAGFIALLRAS